MADQADESIHSPGVTMVTPSILCLVCLRTALLNSRQGILAVSGSG